MEDMHVHQEAAAALQEAPVPRGDSKASATVFTEYHLMGEKVSHEDPVKLQVGVEGLKRHLVLTTIDIPSDN